MIKDFPAYFNEELEKKINEGNDMEKAIKIVLKDTRKLLNKIQHSPQDNITIRPKNIDSSTLDELRQLNGEVVELTCKITDVFDLEMFAAIAKKKDSDVQKYIFFNDQNIGALSKDGEIDQWNILEEVLSERNVAFVHQMKIGGSKMVSASELFGVNLQKMREREESRDRFPFVAKFYDQSFALKLDEVLKIYAVISISSTDHGDSMNCNEEMPDIQYLVDDHFVPTLHVFHTEIVSSQQQHSEKIKKEDLDIIRDCFDCAFRGDRISSTMYLTALLATIQHVGAEEIDAMNINFFGFPDGSEDIKRITELTKKVVSSLIYSPVSLESLSKQRFYGKKNYTTNCIERGSIELQKGDTWIIDETSITTGILNELGVKNANFINRLMADGKCFYDFDYFPFESLCQIHGVSFSKTRSIFTFPIKMQYFPLNEHVEQIKELELKPLKMIILAEIPNSLIPLIEADFASTRQKNPHWSAASLKNCLSVSKTIAALEGESEIRSEHYFEAKAIVEEVIKRSEPPKPINQSKGDDSTVKEE